VKGGRVKMVLEMGLENGSFLAIKKCIAINILVTIVRLVAG
jgi:hypothetical protein